MAPRLAWPIPESQYARMLRLIGEPTRLSVLERLLGGSRHVGELNSAVAVEQSLLSHHLRVLRDAGLVEAVRDGRAMLYRLSPTIAPRPGCREIDLGCCRLVFETTQAADVNAGMDAGEEQRLDAPKEKA